MVGVNRQAHRKLTTTSSTSLQRNKRAPTNDDQRQTTAQAHAITTCHSLRGLAAVLLHTARQRCWQAG